MDHEEQYHLWVAVYVICGMSLGMVMALTHHHVHYVPHANILLVGFVLSLVHGVIHKLWIVSHTFFTPSLSIARFFLHAHQGGALTMFTALLLLYGEVFLDQQIEPLPAVVSVTVLIATMTILHMVKFSPAETR